MTPLEMASLAVLALLAALGSWMDIRHRLLPNWLCLVALAAGLAFSYLSGGPVGLAMATAHALVALLVGMALFAGKVIGGGDAKFYAALASWFPIQQGLFLLVSVAFAGLFLSLVVLFRLRRRSRKPAFGLARQEDDNFRKVPYGVAIAIGAMISHAMLAG